MSKSKPGETVTVDDGAPPPDGGMDDAPRDGRWIEVYKDGAWTRARFYETRMRMAGSVAWVSVSCWSAGEPSRYASRIENPTAWRWPREVTLAI